MLHPAERDAPESATPETTGGVGTTRAWLASHRQWMRVALAAAIGGIVFGGLIIFAYQLALARVPQHRATLERIVQARTGLNVRFNELGLRWGWYGPEAVFRRVELGEPERSNVVIRASELTVGFDAFRTLQSGQLQAGRITLIAPDINLVRARTSESGGVGQTSDAQSSFWNRRDLLNRWPRGRVDVEGGTLKVPGPEGSGRRVTIQIRNATLRRGDDVWIASANLFLPERLGRSARVSLRLQGNAADDQNLRGTMQLEGRRLIFSGWHDLLARGVSFGGYLPAAGSGDLIIGLALRNGRIAAADGEIRADGITFRAEPNAEAARIFELGYLRGDWKVVRVGERWDVNVEDLALGTAGRDLPRTTATLQLTRDGFTGKIGLASLSLLTSAARWWLEDFDLRDAQLLGVARDVTFDWAHERPGGQRLNIAAQVDDLSLQSALMGIVLSGLSAKLSASESLLTADIEATRARLELARIPETLLEDLALTTHLELRQVQSGWQLVTEGLQLAHEQARLDLAGEVSLPSGGLAPLIDARGTLTDADLLFLKSLIGEDSSRLFGAAADRLSAGRIERAEFQVKRPGELKGSAVLREASLAADEIWPEIQGLDATLSWDGPHVTANIERATVNTAELVEVSANWNVDGKRQTRVEGQLHGQLEDISEWLKSHPDMQSYAPDVHTLAVRGPAVVDFRVSVPGRETKGAGKPPRVHVAALLDGAELHPPGMPPITEVRGAIAFDSGRLQRSTLTASWLGGPVTLRVAQQRRRGMSGLSVSAQGMLEAEQLAAMFGIVDSTALSGRAPWKGELFLTPASDERPHAWTVRADTSLEGVVSTLPAPLRKQQAESVRPLHIEFEGEGETSQLRIALANTLRGSFALGAHAEGGWNVARAGLRFGGGESELPSDTVIDLQGRLARLDLPEWMVFWQRHDSELARVPVRANVSVGELFVAGRRFSEVSLQAERDDEATVLALSSDALTGSIRWPSGLDAAIPVSARFAQLTVPEPSEPGELLPVLAALGEVTELSVEQFSWGEEALGRLSARLLTDEESVTIQELKLAGATFDAQAALNCRPSALCQASFELQSRDAAATLRDFGFRDEITAKQALFQGKLEWQPGGEQPFLSKLGGTVNLQLADGTVRTVKASEGRYFALLGVPALARETANVSATPVASSAVPVPADLAFRSLDAQFELRDGEAQTSNLHFDGDAEIIMRGRVGLTARDYDYVAWILRGEERLPAAVRKFGATPRVAAIWMALRGLVSGPETERYRAVVRLGGTWDEPVVGPVDAEASDDAS